jgi:hypothetical protein
MNIFKNKISLLFILFSCSFTTSISNNIIHQKEIWPAYFLQKKFSSRWSSWSDIHLVPEKFFVVRNGMFYNINSKTSFGGGYAWVTTATSFSNKLSRAEHRPWCQIEYRTPINDILNYRFRIRYDARFRKVVYDNQILDDFSLNNRIRFMNSIRIRVLKIDDNRNLYTHIMQESLFNFSAKTKTSIQSDQYRFFVMLGYEVQSFSFNIGYVNRIISGETNTYINHGVNIWLIHQISVRKKSNKKGSQ